MRTRTRWRHTKKDNKVFSSLLFLLGIFVLRQFQRFALRNFDHYTENWIFSLRDLQNKNPYIIYFRQKHTLSWFCFTCSQPTAECKAFEKSKLNYLCLFCGFNVCDISFLRQHKFLNVPAGLVGGEAFVGSVKILFNVVFMGPLSFIFYCYCHPNR